MIWYFQVKIYSLEKIFGFTRWSRRYFNYMYLIKSRQGPIQCRNKEIKISFKCEKESTKIKNKIKSSYLFSEILPIF